MQQAGGPSAMATTVDTAAERNYLDRLAGGLGIDQGLKAQVEGGWTRLEWPQADAPRVKCRALRGTSRPSPCAAVQNGRRGL